MSPNDENKELFAVLEELPDQPLTGGPRAKSVIDWDDWRQRLVDMDWFQIGEVQKAIEAELKAAGIEKTVYYSQVQGTIVRMAKKDEYTVRKVVLEEGPDAGAYYKIEMV